ncbi:Ribosomal RNA small subunit methyltransferase NEP1 [Zostera marina]|uniref:Ribosomal RNA small subunit methyltransferase NEP1 n=1 Tax=Zostera marina TaxID=29655 RepID=A0A0K9NUN5_ZOSMR|nr:Ribosomal RNA small subunit methyltransferase NEP1 [Zostera marina]
MVRPYAVKWMQQQKKRQKKESPEHESPPSVPSEDEDEVPVVEEYIEEVQNKKRKKKDKKKNVKVDKPKEEDEGGGEEEEEEEEEKQVLGKMDITINSNTENKLTEFSSPLDMLPGLPSTVAPVDKSQLPGVIFVVEKASLRVGKVGKKEQILSGDEHATFLTRQKLNPADFRPDIVHQVLLSILDRPLTKAGRLTALYVKTDDGELFEVKPHVRLPRTFRRFSGLMYQLKSVKHIHASGKRENLFRMIKNPVTRHLPVNARKIGFSYSSEKLVKMRDYVAAASDDVPLVFVVGAMAHGKIDADYTDDLVSVSEYPLSGACCVNRVCEALEQKWNIM